MFLNFEGKETSNCQKRHTKLGNPFICDEAEEDNDLQIMGFFHAQIIHLIQVQTNSL